MTVEIVPPGQSLSPGPEVTTEDVLLDLIDAALNGAKHIATYPPKQRLLDAVQAAVTVLKRDSKD